MRIQQLFEYNRDATAKNWGAKLLAAANKDKSYKDIHQLRVEKVDERYLPDILQRLEAADPTKNKEYTQWLAKVYSTGTIKIEDIISRGADALAKYVYAKRKNLLKPEHKDIGRLSFKDVEDIAIQVPQVPQEQKQQNAVQYYKDKDLRIIIPHDEEAACYYGQGTKWCTAARTNNMFKHYSKKGLLYIIIPTKPEYPGEKYQFNFETYQFMNEKDERADLTALVRRYPQLQEIFKEEADKHSVLPLIISPEKLLMFWNYALDYLKDQIFKKMIEKQDSIKNLVVHELKGYSRKHVGLDWEEARNDIYFMLEDLFNTLPLAKMVGSLNHVIRNSDFTEFHDEEVLEDALRHAIIPEWLNQGAPGLIGGLADLYEIDEESDEMYDIYHEIIYTLTDPIKQITRDVMRELLNKIKTQ